SKAHLVLAASCSRQSSREHMDSPAFFDFAGGAEKFLWLDRRLCFDAARHDTPFAGLQVIIASRKPGEAIEQKHDVLFQFYQSFSPLQHHLGHLNMALHTFVKVGMINLAIDFALEIGYFFRP